MSLPEDEDERLVAAVAGDRAAAESLLLELLPGIRNLIRYLVPGDSEVDDIAQEALVVLIRNLHTYRGEGNGRAVFRAWLGRVVARVTFAYVRRRREDVGEVGAVRTDLQHVPAADVEEYLDRRHLVSLLDQLSAEQRYAMVLHHVLEMSVPEVASELGVSVETVRSRLRLARTRLRARGLHLVGDQPPEDVS